MVRIVAAKTVWELAHKEFLMIQDSMSDSE